MNSMTIGNTVIAYGADLPTGTDLPDGLLFLRNGQVEPGLYVFNTKKDPAFSTSSGRLITTWTNIVPLDTAGAVDYDQFARDFTVVSTASIALTPGRLFILSAPLAITASLPAGPSVNDEVWITSANGRTDNVIARNGSLLFGLTEDAVIDLANFTVKVRYISPAIGWVMV